MWGIIKFCHVAQLHHIININNMEWIKILLLLFKLQFPLKKLQYSYIVLYFNLKFVMDMSAQF